MNLLKTPHKYFWDSKRRRNIVSGDYWKRMKIAFSLYKTTKNHVFTAGLRCNQKVVSWSVQKILWLRLSWFWFFHLDNEATVLAYMFITLCLTSLEPVHLSSETKENSILWEGGKKAGGLGKDYRPAQQGDFKSLPKTSWSRRSPEALSCEGCRGALTGGFPHVHKDSLQRAEFRFGLLCLWRHIKSNNDMLSL